MINLLSILFNKNLNLIYDRTQEIHGFSPEGVLWVSEQSQHNRFKVIIKLIEKYAKGENIKIADVGCGYGEFLKFIKLKKKNFEYEGYDINNNFINYCLRKYPGFYFENSPIPKNEIDFSIMSGTYNLSVISNCQLWEKYIFYNLQKIFLTCKQGIIFNLQLSNKSKIKNKIYYADDIEMKKELKKRFRNVFSFFDKLTEKDIYFIILK